MKEIYLQEDKQIGLETLSYFSNFCREHNLKYQIGYGTLIGAVRHQGFIPWDDDIDVWMMRRDYDKLLELAACIENDKYILNAIETNNQFLFTFAKLSRKDTVLLPSRFMNGYTYGASIDIFPLDSLGVFNSYEQAKQEYAKLREKHQKYIERYHAYTGGTNRKSIKTLLKKCLYHVANIYYGKIDKRIKEYARMLASNAEKDSEYVVTIAGETLYKREWFEETIEMKFEDIIVLAPAGYDEILRCRYGDYLQLPPEKERILPHSFQVFYLDK